MRIIRQYIRKLLIEKMTKPSSMLKRYALWTNLNSKSYRLNYEDRAYFLLYDIDEAYEKLKNKEKISGSLEGREFLELVFGKNYPDITSGSTCVKAAFIISAHDKDCNKAWEILFAAALNGLGPTMYDMIMSISPNGIVSDRSSVSDMAQNVYSFYAHRRDDISKTFLDSRNKNYTQTTIDDCELYQHGDELNSAMVEWTVEFLTNNYPESYEKYLEEVEPDSDDAFSAEEYLSEFLDWLETSPYQQDDRTEIYEEWKEMLSTDQKYLIDFHKGEFENGSYLDVSYNTDYAKQSFESLVKNHNEFIMNQITGKDFKWYDISEIIEDIDEDDLETLTGTFFDGINVRHVQKERGVDS